MNKRIQKLLKRNKPVKAGFDRQKIFDNINRLLDGKTCGILLLSEIEKDGRDKVSTLAFNCDKKHSALVLSYLIARLPRIKTSLDKIMKTEFENKQIFTQMVR